MTQEEKEFNEKCAKFLYPNAKEEYETGNISIEDGIFKKAMFIFGHFDSMKFNSDWNWIMEVVEAIEKLGYWVEIVHSNIGTTKRPYKIFWCEILKENHHDLLLEDYHTEIVRGESLNNQKEAVIQAIDKFLTWYENEKIQTN